MQTLPFLLELPLPFDFVAPLGQSDHPSIYESYGAYGSCAWEMSVDFPKGSTMRRTDTVGASCIRSGEIFKKWSAKELEHV